ncbi:hypothetical protein Syun_006597 [Stephania yunnanensis]|uniref:Probable zinc-ribbon domain-containing protein n=1 Tax=Stephania yunnanensis TaxID=152371 RepID=A0AAP0Q1I2_9MAGN
MNVNVEDENQPVKLPSKPVNRKNDSSFVGDSPLEPVSHDTEALQNLNRNDSERFHQVPYFKGLEKDDPFLKERQINGRRKSADYDHFQSSFRLYLAENHKLDERGQLELLKKLDELRDHLNKSYALGRKPKEHISPRYAHQEKHRPFHGMQILRDRENLAHCTSCHPQQQRPEAFKLRKSTTYRGGCSHSFQTRLGSECMHRADIPHSHGFHEDWNCLQKFEPPAPNTCYDRGLHQTCTGYKCYNPYSITSSPSRPLRFNSPCRGCDEVQPRHHMQRNFDNEVAKLRHEEKRHGLKQQCRPMVGGAPFITCYHCSQLLKIPEEFLHASKRSHTLQCGSCSKVLMFSLHKTIHIVPHSPKSVLPPSSDEVANGAHQISSAGNSSNADCCIQGDSTSYSEEEYGLPTFKSCSTESEPALPTPAFPSSQINTADQIKPSSIHTALQNCNMKKIAMSILNSKNKHPIDFRKNVGSSSDQARLSLKAEAGHGTGSPLHRLMGYSSPTDIINGTGTAIIPS